MAVSANDPRPQHQQIADDLRQRIVSGDLQPGDRIPTIAALMDAYGVYNQTVQGALRQLKDEGLTTGVPGRGTFVRADLDLSDLADGGDGGTPEFQALSGKLDAIAAELEDVKRRLGQVEDAQAGERSASTS